MEKRKANIIISKSGGNAGKNSVNTKISLPKSWCDKMGFTNEDRLADIEFDGVSITIRKGMEE